MKQIIAIAVLIASAQASAFWGWNDGRGDAYNSGYVDGAGNADAEADFSFDVNFTARMRGDGRGSANGYGYGAGDGYGYNAQIPYYRAPYGYLPPPVIPMPAE